VQYWLGEGLGAGRKRITGWIKDLGDRLVDVDVDGTNALIMREHLDDLTRSAPSEAIRLLPGHDQWVLGPGTADANVVPPQQRALITRGDNVVIAGGVVSGTWSRRDDRLAIGWLSEAGGIPQAAVAEEVARLATILDRPLDWTVPTA
jgi:hypothetical protein